jgi:hypothetical protein
MTSDRKVGSNLNDIPSLLKEAVRTLYCSFNELKRHLRIQTSNAKMFSILQEFPCLKRCIDEFKKPNELLCLFHFTIITGQCA